MMRLRNGSYECAYCGALLDIPLVSDPSVMIKAASGEPNIRTLIYDGKEIHSCVMLSPQAATSQIRERAARAREQFEAPSTQREN